jgi:hypothetical protein
MTGSVLRKLIVKDLYLQRWLVLGAIASGAGSVAVMPFGNVGAYVGGVMLICILIVLNIMLVSGMVQEKRDKVLLFVLSLPISTGQYLAAKVAANAIGFLVPWLTLTAATTVLIDASGLPNGILPYWIALLGYLLFYFLALHALALVRDSMGWQAAGITIGNISVNFLIPILLQLPSVKRYAGGASAVWTPDLVAITALEIAAGIGLLALAVRYRSRHPDFA